MYEIETIKVRLAVSDPLTSETVTTPAQVVTLLRAIYADLDADQEHFVMLARDGAGRILGFKVITSGAQDASLVDPRILFRAALLMGAAAIIVAHNHPSRNPAPSQEDIAITRRLDLAGETLSLRILDHVILAEKSFFSFKEQGLL